MFTYARRSCKVGLVLVLCLLTWFAFATIYNLSVTPHFGKQFGNRASVANRKLQNLEPYFNMCAALCQAEPAFMQSMVFPEVMRYNSLRDGVEAESLRTLYVQLGEDYANFSIGIFQMKPSFAAVVEAKAKQHLPTSMLRELQLGYAATSETNIRQERLERLQDEHWQLVYLTAFTAICNSIYADQPFSSREEKLQWYATVYNAGFDKPVAYIRQKIKQDNFYFNENMPGKKFKYAAIVLWHYRQQIHNSLAITSTLPPSIPK